MSGIASQTMSWRLMDEFTGHYADRLQRRFEE
jgi:hypothetical protein